MAAPLNSKRMHSATGTNSLPAQQQVLDVASPLKRNGKRRAPPMKMRRTLSGMPPVKAGLGDDCLALLTSSSRALTYALHVSSRGLTVDRHQATDDGNSLLLTMHFSTANDFGLWWSSDPLRFEEPHLFHQLFKRGHDAFRAEC